MKKTLLRIILGLAAVAAIVLLAWKSVSWSDAEAAILALSGWNLIVLAFAVFAISAVKAWRFYVILHYGDLKAPFLRTMRIFLATQAFTPLPGGEVMRAMLFKRELPARLHEVAGPVLLQATLELWSAELWVLFGALFAVGEWTWWISALLALMVVTTVPLFFTPLILKWLEALKQRGFFPEWMEKASTALTHFRELVSTQNKASAARFWFSVIGLGLLSHAIAGGLLWYVANLEGVHLTFFQAVFAATLGVLIQGLLSIIPGGLGVTEGGIAGVLTSFGTSWSQSVVVTLVYRVAMLPFLIVIALLFMAPLYFKRGQKK